MPAIDPEALNPAYEARAKARGVEYEQARELSEKDLELARKQFLSVYEDEKELRARIKDDHEYYEGVRPDGKSKRWKDDELAGRKGRPALHIDAIGGPIDQVVNGIAEGRPAADMMPLGAGATDESAEVWEGVIRRIQTTPEAEHAGAYAASHLVPLGCGSWVLTAKYPDYNGDPNDPANWEMEICRKWIENQHSVWLGPAREPDGSDRTFGFILEPLSKDQFDERFGEGEFDKNKSAFADLKMTDEQGMSAWSSVHTITVASWYRVKFEDVMLQDPAPGGGTRKVKQRIVCLSTITAAKEYEYSELPIPYIPIVHGRAKYSNIDGQKDIKGMVRAMRDPQDLVNVYPSYIAETVAQGARTEIIAATGQIHEGNAKFWDMTRRLPYREYEAVGVDGTLLPPPTIQTFEPPIQGMTLALQQAEGFVRKAGGAYDADSDQTRSSLSKESGRAREERRRQSELGNSGFSRVYQFMILYEVKIILAWAPHVYSNARALRLSGRNEETFAAVTHFGQETAPDAQQLASQIPVPKGAKQPVQAFDLKAGRYDMKARVIRNPLTQRQENQDVIKEVLPALPPPLQARVMPILFEEMGGTIGKRLAAAVKPDEQAVNPEEFRKSLMLIDVLTEQVNQLKQEKEAKQTENESKQAIAVLDSQTKVKLEELKFAHELALKQLEMEMQLKMQARGAMIDAVSREAEHEHTSEDADKAHARGLESTEHAAATEFALREPEGDEAP